MNIPRNAIVVTPWLCLQWREGNRPLTWGKFGNRFSGETAEIELLRDGNIVKVQTTLKTPVRLVCSNSLNLLLHRTWGQCSTLVQLNVPPSTISNPKHCDIYTRWNSTICALGTKNYCVLMRERTSMLFCRCQCTLKGNCHHTWLWQGLFLHLFVILIWSM
jgi:hypothetical protein